MTIVDCEDTPEIRRTKPRLVAALRLFVEAIKRRRAKHKTIIALSRLDAHLLRDIGIDPYDVTDAFNGRQSSLLFEPMRRHDHK